MDNFVSAIDAPGSLTGTSADEQATRQAKQVSGRTIVVAAFLNILIPSHRLDTLLVQRGILGMHSEYKRWKLLVFEHVEKYVRRST